MDAIVSLLAPLVSVALFLVAAIGLNLVTVDGIKNSMRMLQKTLESVTWLKRPLEILTPGGDKTFFLSIIMAFLFVAGFDLDFLGDFSIFDNVNATVLTLMKTTLVSFGSNLVHNKQSN